MKKRLLTLALVFALAIGLASPALAMGEPITARQNSETYICTSLNPNNYLELWIYDNTLQVEGKLYTDGLYQVVIEANNVTSYLDVAEGETFSIRYDLNHYGTEPINVWTYSTYDEGEAIGWMYEYIYTERVDADTYRFPQSTMRQSNVDYMSAYIDPAAVLAAAEAKGEEAIPARVKALSDEITAGISSDYQKVFALHKWVAENIYYNRGMMTSVQAIDRITDPVGVLDSRSTVCEGYANLLTALILAQGIPAQYCTNYVNYDSYALTEDGGEFHAHVEAYVDDRWIIMDPTWDSKNQYDYKTDTYTTEIPKFFYFDIRADVFAYSHQISARGELDYIIDENGFGYNPAEKSIERYEGAGGVVTIPSGVEIIGREAFMDNTDITVVILPEGLKEIRYQAFSGCTNLRRVELPSTLTDIGTSSFLGCTNLTYVNIPDSVTLIGEGAFRDCDKLISVTVPAGNDSIFEQSFYDMDALFTAHIGEGVEIINHIAFKNCKNLKYVDIPKSVKSINYEAFYNTDITAVYYAGSEAEWGNITIGADNDKLQNAKIYYNAKMSDGAESHLFTDVPTEMYYYKPVAWALREAITTGTTATTFSPEDTCTNAQILTFLWRAAGEPAADLEIPDLDSSLYYYEAICWAAERGMISGTFYPNAPCTRADTVSFIHNAAGSPETSYTTSFTDVSASAPYAEAVAWAVAAGVTNGTSDTEFSPTDTCTRGQIAAFLYRAFAD